MKPTLAMEEKPAATSIQTPELAFQERRSSKSRWMHAGFSVILALLAVILVFQVLSYRQIRESSGKDMHKNLPEKVEKTVNYHIEENDETVNEKVVVDNREEDITTQKARIIFDYERLIVVYKFIDGEAANVSLCYAATFNKSVSTDDLKEAYLNTEDNQEAHVDDHDQFYESTDETVPRDLLSPSAKIMCKNSKVVMTRITDKKDMEETAARRKRAICWRYACYFYWNWGWRYRCRFVIYLC